MKLKEAIKYYHDNTYTNGKAINVGSFEKGLFRFCAMNNINYSEVASMSKRQRGEMYADVLGKTHTPNGCSNCFGGIQ